MIMGTTVAVILVTILFSAFFSGNEIAFLSSNKLKLELEKKHDRFFSRIADTFTRNPGQFITSNLVGNNAVLVIYSMQMATLTGLLFARWHIYPGNAAVLGSVISTIVIIFLGEYIPKALVRANPNFWFRFFSPLSYFFYILLYPVARFSTWLSRAILRMFGQRTESGANDATFDKIDLAYLIEEASESPVRHENEKDIKLFRNALEFKGTRARESMVPRVDIYAVDVDSPVSEAAEMFAESNFSRLLVYEGSIDNVVGYLTGKSLFNYPATIREAMHEIKYVPESMEVEKIMSDFIKNNESLAVVIDEFGGTAGMITIEDILEEIFGEIEDEHDSQEMVEKVTGENEYVLSGRLEISYLNEKYGLGIAESDEYDTLAGYVIFNNGDIPSQGELLEMDGKSIRILRADSSKIELVKLSLRDV